MAEDRTPRTTSLTGQAASEAETQRRQRDHHRRLRHEPDRLKDAEAMDQLFPGRNEHEDAVPKFL
jgi:hypothetical protein